ncbi:MAG: hypothetical protein ACOC7R_04820 [Planctomycetota bacterium]
MSVLANVMTHDNPAMEVLSRAFRDTSPVSPLPGVIIFGLLAGVMGAYLLWRYWRRQRRAPGPRMLLGRAAGQLGLSAEQRRCLYRLGRRARLEPVAALVSPAMMMELVHRAEAREGKLGGDDARQVASMLDVVVAACDR